MGRRCIGLRRYSAALYCDITKREGLVQGTEELEKTTTIPEVFIGKVTLVV